MAERKVVRYAYACPTCDRITVLEVAIDSYYDETIDCPGCGEVAVDCSDNETQTCLYVDRSKRPCGNYLKFVRFDLGDKDNRCPGELPGGAGECRRVLTTLDDDSLFLVPAGSLLGASGRNAKKPAGVRRLDALLAAARKYVSGPGSHHRSTSGAHTASATERHSRAAHAKKQDRDWYIEQIEAMLQAETFDRKKESEARAVISQLEGK